MLKYAHLRTMSPLGVSGLGGATVACEVSPEGFVLKAAASICNPRDNFSRKVGRIKATGRLKSPRWTITFKDGEVHVRDFIKELRANSANMFRSSKALESHPASIGVCDC